MLEFIRAIRNKYRVYLLTRISPSQDGSSQADGDKDSKVNYDSKEAE